MSGFLEFFNGGEAFTPGFRLGVGGCSERDKLTSFRNLLSRWLELAGLKGRLLVGSKCKASEHLGFQLT